MLRECRLRDQRTCRKASCGGGSDNSFPEVHDCILSF
jgi:hypothetical protein